MHNVNLSLKFTQRLRYFACVQTSPISFDARVPFLHATKEIGDVCTQAKDSKHTTIKWSIGSSTE